VATILIIFLRINLLNLTKITPVNTAAWCACVARS